MLWLYIYLPQLQLDTLYQQLACPTVIVDSSNHCVVQCDQQAIAHNIVVGQSLGSAASLCADLAVITYDSESETAQLTQLAQHCYQQIADVVLVPPQGLLLRITPMLKIHANLLQCWQTIKPLIERVTLHYSVASGYSPLSAQYLAQQQYLEQQTALPLISLETNKESIKRQLAQVALTTTTLPHQVISKLSHIGIAKLGQLINIPLKELAQRFDIEVVNTLGKVKGELHTALTFFSPPTYFSYLLDLNFEVQHTTRLQGPLKFLLGQLEAFLITRELIALELHLTLLLRDKPEQLVIIQSAQGEQQLTKLLALSMLKLEHVKLNAPVTGLKLRSVLLCEKQTLSGDIFAPTAVDSNQLSAPQLISLLQAKLGNDNVQGLGYHATHTPEAANLQYNLTQPPSPNPVMEQVPKLLRPSYLLPSPEPWHDPVTIMHGPERIQTQWWQSQYIERDYYIVKNEQGQWCWLFKQADGQWFIHGYFG